jgi:8-oxo-dGTP pyrophosphatase MutT (NUDIX family)
VLLVQRREPSTPALNGAWELPGGKLLFGEAPEVAVVREVLEETGYPIEPLRLLPHVYSTVWELPDRRRHVVLLTFECRPVGARRLVTDPKVGCIAWLRPDAIDPAVALPSVGTFLNWWRSWPGQHHRP